MRAGDLTTLVFATIPKARIATAVEFFYSDEQRTHTVILLDHTCGHVVDIDNPLADPCTVSGAFVSPPNLVRALEQNEVTHVPYLPDSEHSATYDLLEEHPAISLVRISREGEAFPLAAGLLAGGKKPLTMIQNTGFFESGDSLRGFVIHKQALPMVILLGYRGWVASGEFRDTAALYTEPVLQAWQLPHRLIARNEDLGLIAGAFDEAERTGRSQILLLVEDEGYARRHQRAG